MAHYVVKYNGEYHINRDLAKSFYGIGDAGIFAMLSDGKLVQVKILDCFVYRTTKEDADKMLDRGAIAQDIDAKFHGLKTPGKGSIPYILSENVPTWSLSTSASPLNVSCVRMMDITGQGYTQKYRLLDKLPSLTFLAKRYILLGVAEKGLDCVAELKSN